MLAFSFEDKFIEMFLVFAMEAAYNSLDLIEF